MHVLLCWLTLITITSGALVALIYPVWHQQPIWLDTSLPASTPLPFRFSPAPGPCYVSLYWLRVASPMHSFHHRMPSRWSTLLLYPGVQLALSCVGLRLWWPPCCIGLLCFSVGDMNVRYIYFNHMNLATKTTVHVDSRKTRLVNVPVEVLSTIADLNSDLKGLVISRVYCVMTRCAIQLVTWP